MSAPIFIRTVRPARVRRRRRGAAFHVELSTADSREERLMMKKRRLGKGLESLIGPGEDRPVPGDGVGEIPLARIEVNPFQPREHIEEEALGELADSIRSAGILQPVVVRPAGEGMYELVMGERRLRAARRAGLRQVPAIVRELEDGEMLELALIENVQRQDLGAIEKARALARMCGELGMTQERVAERIGLGRPTVANLLRLLELPEEVQRMVSRGTLSAGHARAVLSAGDEAARLALARKIASEGLSVREAERLAAGREGAQERPAPEGGARPAHVQRLQAILSEKLGADVQIRSRGRKGQIVIHFNDHEHFERLFTSFTGDSGMPS